MLGQNKPPPILASKYGWLLWMWHYLELLFALCFVRIVWRISKDFFKIMGLMMSELKKVITYVWNNKAVNWDLPNFAHRSRKFHRYSLRIHWHGINSRHADDLPIQKDTQNILSIYKVSVRPETYAVMNPLLVQHYVCITPPVCHLYWLQGLLLSAGFFQIFNFAIHLT